MAKRKLRKPLLLQEEFAAGEVSNPNQNATPAVQTNPQTVGIDKIEGIRSGEEVRAEIVKDVDSILTNLEALSKQISESIDEDFFFEGPVNESLDSIIDFVKKESNFVKGMALLKGKYGKLLQMADSNIISAQEYDAIKKLDVEIDKMRRTRDEAKGPKKEAIQQKATATIEALKKKKGSIDSKFDQAKEAARQTLEDVEEKMKKYEGNMPEGTQGDLYNDTKRKIKNDAKMAGLKEKGRMLKEKGDADAAKETADELKKLGVRSKEADAGMKELSKDVDSVLEEKIKKIQTEIDREKDEDLVPIQDRIADLKKELTDDKLDAKEKQSKQNQLEKMKVQEDKTLEQIDYLEDEVEKLKAQRSALKDKEVEEGNAFGAARAEAIAKGEDTFKVGDEEYPVEDVGADDKENAEEYAEEEGIKTEESSHPVIPHYLSVSEKMKIILKR